MEYMSRDSTANNNKMNGSRKSRKSSIKPNLNASTMNYNRNQVYSEQEGR